MGASRRTRRAHGRIAAAAPTGSSKGGIAKGAKSKASRKVDKASILAAARAARLSRAQAPPRLFAVVPLSSSADSSVHTVSQSLRQGADTAVIEISRAGGSNRDWLIAVLDAGKVADVVVLVFGATHGDGDGDIDEPALEAIAALRAQGLPLLVSVATGAGACDTSTRRTRGRKLAAESLGIDSDLRPYDMDEEGGPNRVLRKCLSPKERQIAWRKRYGYMLVESADAVLNQEDATVGVSDEQCSTCTMQIRGCVRGAGMSSNRLLMITGVGAFKIGRISAPNETGGVDILGVRDEAKAEPPESLAPLDTLTGEQTWPPEMNDTDMVAGEGTIKQRVPKGMSEYQAAWLPDKSLEEGSTAAAGEKGVISSEAEVKDSEVSLSDGENAMGSKDVSDVDASDDDVSGEPDDFAADAASDMADDEQEDDMEVDAEEVSRVRAAAAAQMDREFPDEVDTPIDTAARVRFARYRGLKSFRTSSWDPKEQLPRAYARLFQFANLNASRKRVLAEALSSSGNDIDAAAGKNVVITLVDVPTNTAKQVVEVVAAQRTPVVASCMLKHENRRSVVHFGVQRVDDAEDEAAAVVKAKDPMEIHCGFARFEGRPMYSEQNSNSDKHKMERYLVHGRYTVASFYGPAIYAPAPALLFRPGEGLVATGSALGADPDRIILKRLVLTGYPFKTQKKRVVVKFMFFSPEDIRWFRPVELWTKLGRSGHIVEPLGTHGRMKCIFDAPVLHHDTVCMTLYKRVYPKEIDAVEE